jgi:hypothetical protein
MITNRAHLLRHTSLVNVVAVHQSFHWNPVYLVALPGMLGLEILAFLQTEGITISIPVATHPLVSFPCVH